MRAQKLNDNGAVDWDKGNLEEAQRIANNFNSKYDAIHATSDQEEQLRLEKAKARIDQLLKQITNALANPAQTVPTGGIDFSSQIGIQIQRDANGMPLSMDAQDPALLTIPGLIPVIEEIHPLAPSAIPHL